MYAMKAVSPLVFRTMMFPHAGKEEWNDNEMFGMNPLKKQ